MSTSTVLSALSALTDELGGDRAAAIRFASSWLELLPRRLDVLEHAVREDGMGAQAVLLTLRCTSGMLGALELAAEASTAVASADACGGIGVASLRTVVESARQAQVFVREAVGKESGSEQALVRDQGAGANR